MNRPRVIVESPLSGDFLANRRYATWCCRYLHEEGYSPLASHLVAPWFMDDRDADERAAGIDMPWFWMPDVPHDFFVDFGMSSGMLAGMQRCRDLGIPTRENLRLPSHHLQSCLEGKWPPHTPGFGPDSLDPRGWCDPEHPNFDAKAFERALIEQEAYDASLASKEEASETSNMIASMRQLLRRAGREGSEDPTPKPRKGDVLR